jgi:hypothetical protein
MRLRDAGLDDHVMAVVLDLDDDQVPVLMEIAHRKLNHLMAPPVTEPPANDTG